MNRREAREMALNCQAKWEFRRRRVEPNGQVYYMHVVHMNFTDKPRVAENEPSLR